jgi:O-antigen ligase
VLLTLKLTGPTFSMRNAAFMMTALVMTISSVKSTYFLDSINWPKQIALVSIAPILIIIATQGNFVWAGKISIKVKLLVTCLGIQIIHLYSEGTPSHQKIWGQLDSSNGVITIAALLLISIAFAIFHNKLFLENLMLLFLFSTGVIFSFLKIVNLVDPINFYGNTNIVSFMLAIAFVCGLRFTFDPSMKTKARSFSVIGIAVISITLFGMEDFQGKVIAVLGTLFVLIYTQVRTAKTRSFLYFLLLILSITSFAVFLGWIQSLTAYTQETLQLRIMFWRTSIEMATNNLLFGVGAENFQSSFRDYADASALETIGSLPSPDNAHNYFLHLLSTLGFFGAISIICPFLVALIILFKERRNQINVGAIVFNVVFILIWLDLGISVSNVSVTVLGMAFLGIILGRDPGGLTSEIKKRKGISILSPTLIVLASALCVFAVNSTQIDREILRIQIKPIDFNNSAEIAIRIKKLSEITNNPKILKSEISVIALDLEALEAISFGLSNEG